ncbi:protein kinase-like protein [Mumia flava]|uniref:Protein kinase-like protein n=1 Tax=Mumia flava TaxID=1348852 RepID=A0A0B2B777_9ACTN|nr:protein kinase [Mumia flava]PJJ57660.1 protein kinase-like protein [Mumia flava]
MDQTAQLSSGTVLSGRYRLDDLIKESGGAVTWKAYDTVLSRPVGVQALRADDRRSTAFVLAAGRSTAVADPRFLRILDIVEDDLGHTYLVREWARAVSLDHVLDPTTLTNRRSATVVAEVAEAMAEAHAAGVYHRHLRPATVLLKDNGAVRVIGLATDHALRSAHHDVDEADVGYAEQLDVEALGKLLYACLTGRYPGGDEGLPAAPREHGRLLRPRQVRAGVGRDVDVVCDQILGRPPRHHRAGLHSARDIALELAMTGEDEPAEEPEVLASSPDLFRHDPVRVPEGPPPGVTPKRRPQALEPPPPNLAERGVERLRRATDGERKLIWLAVVVIVLLAIGLTFVVGRASAPGGDSIPSDQPTAADPVITGSVVDLPVDSVTSFDPEPDGDGSENPDAVGLAVDGDPETAWTTLEYYNQAALGGLKEGVGLMLDLGDVHDVESVQALFVDAPISFQVYVAPDRSREPTRLDQMKRVGNADNSPTGASVSLGEVTRTQYVLLWLTELPAVDDDVFQGGVAEVVVRGYA